MTSPVLSINEISDLCEPVASRLPIKSLYLFGSYADGSADADSDIDLVCDFEDDYKPGISFLRWDELFQSALGKDVDLLTVDGVQSSCSAYLRDSFKRNALRVYTRE